MGEDLDPGELEPDELQAILDMKRSLGLEAEEPSPPHCDEHADSMYHYSALLYLNTKGEEFEGGDFTFNDQPSRVEAGGTSRVSPKCGLGLFFTSGWENLHSVAPVRSGCRIVVPIFFSTRAS